MQVGERIGLGALARGGGVVSGGGTLLARLSGGLRPLNVLGKGHELLWGEILTTFSPILTILTRRRGKIGQALVPRVVEGVLRARDLVQDLVEDVWRYGLAILERATGSSAVHLIGILAWW